ncbi:hypothetical protein B0H16DRAFT_1584892 [Mycena metata]|uniref:Uncharacterized protein n=1 Tax=Mycena metata TaxID=1033252 RepID=A0AAD7HZW3_9AGAR|nr:hypothetical protein B0H16DRAFT_1584892 [Mycena metata]
MPDITILPANLATVVLDSFLYGLLFLLFTLTVYFLATRRTLAGTRRTTKHHFTSLVFIGVAALFLVVTVHWSIVIYQAFFAFIHLANPVAEDAFYANLGQISEVIKNIFLFIAILLGDALVTYRLWVIWGRNRLVVMFPLFALSGLAVTALGIIIQLTHWEPKLRGTLFHDESQPWTVTGFVLSLLANIYSTGFIIFRIRRVGEGKSRSDSRLMSFLAISVESAAFQTLWLIVAAMTQFGRSDVEFIATDTFPAIVGISNTLIHARVGLGWSQEPAQSPKPYNGDAV